MKQEFVEFYDECIKVWGEDFQILMCIEEMSELTKELAKTFRNDTGKSPEQIEKICSEIADVLNMTEQMQHMFGEKRVEEIRLEKMKRTKLILEDAKRRKA